MRHAHQTNFILISLLVAIARFVCQPANAQVQTGTDTAFGTAAFQSGQGNNDTAIGSDLKQQLQAALNALRSKDQLVAQR